MMETRLMIKPEEFLALVDYYKGKITESTLLEKAARVAAEAQLVLNNPHTPAGLKVPVANTLLGRERDLTEQLRAIPTGSGPESAVNNDPGNVLDSIQHQFMKQLIGAVRRGNKSTLLKPPQKKKRRTLPATPVTPYLGLPLDDFDEDTGKKEDLLPSWGVWKGKEKWYKSDPGPEPDTPVSFQQPMTPTSQITDVMSQSMDEALAADAELKEQLKNSFPPGAIKRIPKVDTPKNPSASTRQKWKNYNSPEVGNRSRDEAWTGSKPMAANHRKKRRPRNPGKGKGGVKRKSNCKRYTQQTAGTLDIESLIAKTGKEFHWPGYQYLGPGTKLAMRLKRGDPGINRLDRVAKQNDLDYSHSKSLADKHRADLKMVAAIRNFPGRITIPERIIDTIMSSKVKLGI